MKTRTSFCPMATSSPEMASVLREIKLACRFADMSQTAFGRAAVNDPGLVFGLRNGRTLRASTAARVLAYVRSLAAGREVTRG